MKKRKIVAVTVAGLVSSTALVWADTVKTINQNGTEYVSAEELSKKLGGKSMDSEDGLVISIGSNKVEIGKGSSFAKVNGEYMALDTDEVDGFVVPKATKIMKKGDSSYIPVEFLKNNKLGEYTIGNSAISIGGKVESSTTEEDKEDNPSPGGSTSRPGTGGSGNSSSGSGSTNRPGTGGSGGSSSGSGSTNRPGTGGSGSGSGGSGSTNRPGTGGSGNSSGSNGSSGNGGSNNSGSGSGSTGNEGGNSGSNGSGGSSGGNGGDNSGSGSTDAENPGGGNGNSGSETESGGETSTSDTIQSE